MTRKGVSGRVYKIIDNTVVIIGVGGAGCSIADYFRTQLGYRTILVNTDKTGLSKFPGREHLLIGNQRNHEVVTLAKARLAAENSREILVAMMSSAQIVVLVAGLGGNTGTGACPAIISIATMLGKKVIAVVTLPFLFEGARRKMALASLEEIERSGATVIIHDHATAFEKDSHHSRSLEAVLEDSAKAMCRRTIASLRSSAE